MNAIAGVAGFASTMLFFAWAVRTFRRADAARWARSETAAIAVSLLATVGFAFSSALLLRFAEEVREMAMSAGPARIAAAAAVFAAVLFLLVFRRIFGGRAVAAKP